MKGVAKTAAPKASGSDVTVRWFAEVKNADKAEERARKQAYIQGWLKEDKTRLDGSTASKKAWKSAKGTYELSPAPWLKARHAHTQSPPGCRTRLPNALTFTKTTFTVAALNCGYGASGERLTGQAVGRTGAFLDLAFARCLDLRTEFLVSTIDFANVKPQPFMSMFETAERADVSFLIGNATSYLVADAWLNAGGRRLKAYWHFSLYCPALISGAPGAAFKNTEAKTNETAPDFIAVDNLNQVHLFESKGGLSAKNSEVLHQALSQLANVEKVSLHNLSGSSTPATIATRMAVRTVVEFNRRFEVLAYDPPADGRGSHLRVEFNVAWGLQVLESATQFKNLLSPAQVLDFGLLVREVGGTHLVMCTNAPYNDLESRLRAYIAIWKALPDTNLAPVASVRDSDSRDSQPVWRQLARDNVTPVLPHLDDSERQSFERALMKAKLPGALLPEFSQELGIPDLMRQFERSIETAKVQLKIWGSTRFNVRVLPGLLIQLIDWDGDMNRMKALPKGVKPKI